MHINLAVSLWCSCVSEWHFNGCGSIPGPDWPHRFTLSSLIINYWFFFLLNFFLKIISASSSTSVEGKPKYTPNSRNFRGKYDFFPLISFISCLFIFEEIRAVWRPWLAERFEAFQQTRLHSRQVKVSLLVPVKLSHGTFTASNCFLTSVRLSLLCICCRLQPDETVLMQAESMLHVIAVVIEMLHEGSSKSQLRGEAVRSFRGGWCRTTDCQKQWQQAATQADWVIF